MSTEQNGMSNLVYHHTDHGAVAGILSKHTFRFSHIDYLNDSSERRHVHDYIEQYIQQEKLRHGNDPDMVNLLEVILDENRSAARMSESSAQYIACFTKSKNELSQWRGYSRNVPSYAIAFRRRELVDAIGKILAEEKIGSARGREVTYLGPNKGKSTVSDLIQSKITLMKEKKRDGVANLNYEAGQLGDLVHSFFSDNRPAFFKHDGFYQEDEFRIAVSLWHSPPQTSAVKFDVWPAATAMKPFIQLEYGPEVMRSIIDHMIVGPTPEVGLARRALELYRASLGYDFPVEYCDIPFRPGW